jgi:hypothetical protein
MSSNGRMTNAELSPIGGGYYLANAAAKSFNAMSAEARRRWGRSITVVGGYRTYAKQVYFWKLYRSGRGNLAAFPGTSNHGWGLAVDLSSQWSRWAVDQIGRKYGWSKACSDAASEWWHIKYNPRCTGSHWHPGPNGPRALRKGMRGHDVHQVQVYLYRGYYLRTLRDIDSIFGRGTLAAVKRFQSKNKLKVDGVVGPATLAALKRKYPHPRHK